ncbi:MAG: hypothetical protein EOM08_11590, partial [Clostridia bacterium]|nr:hypothetical protein [Clostridia bacterium]
MGVFFFVLALVVGLIVLVANRSQARRQEIESLKAELRALTAMTESLRQDVAELKQQTPMEMPHEPQADRLVRQETAPRSATEPVARTKVQTEVPVPARTLESVLGKNVLSLAAALLIFAGLVFLGTLVYRYLTDTLKIAALFAISTAMTGLGLALIERRVNAFAQSMLGTGCGSFFISIVLTHLYFNRFSDIGAYTLLVLWLVGCLFLARRYHAFTLSVVAHLGMAVSIVMAYGWGLSDQKLLLLLIYQTVAMVVVLVGNLLVFPLTQRASLLASLLLVLVTSSIMAGTFMATQLAGSRGPFATSLPMGAIAAAFAFQFSGATGLAILVSRDRQLAENELFRAVQMFTGQVLWLALLVIDVMVPVYRLAVYLRAATEMSGWTVLPPAIQLAALASTILTGILVLVVFAGWFFIRSRRQTPDGDLASYSALFLVAAAALLLVVYWTASIASGLVPVRLTGLALLAVLLYAARTFSGRSWYQTGANTLLGLDLLFMLFDGFPSLVRHSNIIWAFVYLAALVGLVWGQWLLFDRPSARRSEAWVRLSAWLGLDFALISIVLATDWMYKTPILLLMLTGLAIVFQFAQYDRLQSGHAFLPTSMGVGNHLLLAISSIILAFGDKDRTAALLYGLLSLMSFVLAFGRIREALSVRRSNGLSGILIGIKLTVLVLAIVHGQTDWFDQAYLLSVISMLTALA